MNFEQNLALILAHTVLLETKSVYSPHGVVDDVRNGGDRPAPSPSESTGQAMQAFINYLPQLMQTTLPQMTPAAQALLGTQQAVGLPTSQLQADIFRQVAPQLAQTSQQIDAANKLAGSQADLAVLQGPGAQSAQQVQALSQQFDPEYYARRAQASNSLSSLMSGGLTPAEEESINRSLNRQNYSMGLLGTPTTTNTVANAMAFGNAARERQLQGLNAANSFLPVSRSGFDPTQVALGRPSINTGQSQFLGVNPQAGQQGLDIANNLFGTTAGFQNQAMQINAQRRDALDRVTQVMGALPSYS